MNLLKRLDNFLSKQQQKIYLTPGEKPPEGVQVQRGRKGGMFYVGTPGKAPSTEEVKPVYSKKVTQDINWTRPKNNLTVGGIKIPPGWRDVKISTNPKTSIQAIGIDSVGRRVYLYTSAAKNKGKAKVFSKLKTFSKYLPKIVTTIDTNFEKSDAAAVLYLIAKTGFRVGSGNETKAKVPAFGASTLLRKHISITGDKIKFNFIGKKGVETNKVLKDKKLAEKFKSILHPDDPLFKTSYTEIKKFLKNSADNKPFTPKDFRTYIGTSVALEEMKKTPAPQTRLEAQKSRKAIAVKVAETLGNTPGVALGSYIAPEVFSSWVRKFPDLKKQNTTISDFLESVVYSPEVSWEEKDSEDMVKQIDSFLNSGV